MFYSKNHFCKLVQRRRKDFLTLKYVEFIKKICNIICLISLNALLYGARFTTFSRNIVSGAMGSVFELKAINMCNGSLLDSSSTVLWLHWEVVTVLPPLLYHSLLSDLSPYCKTYYSVQTMLEQPLVYVMSKMLLQIIFCRQTLSANVRAKSYGSRR